MTLEHIPGGFTFAPNFVLDCRELGKNEILTYFAIARYAKVGNNVAVLLQETIAKAARLHRTSVNESIKKLKLLGYIEVEHQANRRGTIACKYTLNNQGPDTINFAEEYTTVDDSSPEDVFDDAPKTVSEYRTGTSVSTAQVHRVNNSTINNNTNNNSILSKDSIKGDGVANTQKTLFNLAPKKVELSYMSGAALTEYLKGKRGKERSTIKLNLAASGKCSWEELNNTDLVFHYQVHHDSVMPMPLALAVPVGSDAQRLGLFRSNYNMNPQEFYNTIPKFLQLFSQAPECQGNLTFGMLANAHYLIKPLLDSIRGNRDFRVEVNQFNLTAEQRANAPEVY